MLSITTQDLSIRCDTAPSVSRALKASRTFMQQCRRLAQFFAGHASGGEDVKAGPEPCGSRDCCAIAAAAADERASRVRRGALGGEEWHLNELWCFVHPDRRRSTHARRLIEFGKWCADRLSSEEKRVPLLLGIVTRHRLLPKLRLFQRQAPQVGAIFMHGIEVPDSFSQRRLGTTPRAPAASSSTGE